MVSTPLPRGRELDALVAETVMGWVWRRSNVTGRRCLYRENDWPDWMDTAADGTERLVGDWPSVYLGNFSTDDAAALQVVASRPLGVWAWSFNQQDDGRWSASIKLGYCTSYRAAVCEIGDTLSHAICLAAIAAIELTEDSHG